MWWLTCAHGRDLTRPGYAWRISLEVLQTTSCQPISLSKSTSRVISLEVSQTISCQPISLSKFVKGVIPLEVSQTTSCQLISLSKSVNGAISLEVSPLTSCQPISLSKSVKSVSWRGARLHKIEMWPYSAQNCNNVLLHMTTIQNYYWAKFRSPKGTARR